MRNGGKIRGYAFLYFFIDNLTNINFIEAEMAKNRIEELKVQDYQRKRDEMVYN